MKKVFLTFLFSVTMAVAQNVPISKDVLSNIAQQAFTAHNVDVQSVDNGGAWAKSTPFEFVDSAGTKFRACYLLKVSGQEIQVSLVDFKLPSGIKVFSILKPSKADQEQQTSQISQEVNQLLEDARNNPVPSQNATMMSSSLKGRLDAFDIGGLNLNMSVADATALLRQNKPNLVPDELTITMSTPYYEKNYKYLTRFSSPQKLGNSGASWDEEKYSLIYLPEESDLIGLYRFKHYSLGSGPLFNKTVSDLIAKYGPPIFRHEVRTEQTNTNEKAVTTFWAFWLEDSAYGYESSTGWLTVKDGKACSTNRAFGLGSGEAMSFLGSDAGSKKKSKYISSAMYMGPNDTFSPIFNGVYSDNQYDSQCGVVFGVFVQANPENTDEVIQMSQQIVDFSRENSELVKATKIFDAELKAAKNKKLNGGGQHPDL